MKNLEELDLVELKNVDCENTIGGGTFAKIVVLVSAAVADYQKAAHNSPAAGYAWGI